MRVRTLCEYCGCHQVPAIGELADEHDALLQEAEGIRQALASGDRATAVTLLTSMVDHLQRHVHREETGIFAAMREQGDFVEEVDELEGEHLDLDAAIARLHVDAHDFDERVTQLFAELARHIEREDLGIFPVSVVTLRASQWETIHTAHDLSPTFLEDRETATP
jgi:hemerythrin-like domain-containing protein